MFLNFISAHGKVINLAMVVTIEDQSEVDDADEVTRSIALIRTIAGDDILLYDDAAETLLNYVDDVVEANQAALTQLQALAVFLANAAIHLQAQQQGAQQ